ncbi:replication initiation protein RepM [Larsenimonas salina]|uniref:replication initiation protein RepM n=1 Tax=Larsenimonas salina TaxID=1295565 RepID=UPI0020735917|nr:replication initiation protein RepM [Larsenimonas salina]MCM5705844.1 replication initiation protein RepM [Larsenimonas salina]
MPKKPVVKKSNALINASYTISLVEQRLILLAIVSANGELEKMGELTVRAQDYADQWDVSLSTAYESLKDAAEQLFERRFTFQEETRKGLKTTVSRWVSHVAYVEGAASVDLAFAPHVQPLLCDLREKFTHYALEQVAGLSSVHAVRFYELLIAWRSTGQTPVIAVAELRQRLGIDSAKYPRMTDFKRWVLDAAIKQINEHTDITAKYEQHKRGRSITGFSFSLKLKAPEKLQKSRKKKTNAMLENGKRNTSGARYGIPQKVIEAQALPGEGYDDAALRLLEESKTQNATDTGDLFEIR